MLNESIDASNYAVQLIYAGHTHQFIGCGKQQAILVTI